MTPSPNRSGAFRKRISAVLLPVLVTIGLAGIGLCSAPARAQQASVGPTWEAQLTPYLWTPWTDIGIHPANSRLPSVSGTVGFDQVVDHLSWVPFNGEIEFRNGPFGFLGDYIHAPVRAGITTHNILFGSGSSGTVVDTGTAMFLYRTFADPDQYLDAGMGVRVWGFDGNVSLSQGLLPAVSVSAGGAWADPLLAVRYHRELGNGFSATAYGDVGGFGLGAHIDWQVIGTIDYALRPGIDLHAGFRTLNFNFGAPRAGFDVNMYGPIIAATFRF